MHPLTNFMDPFTDFTDTTADLIGPSVHEPIDDSTDLFEDLMDPSPNLRHLSVKYTDLELLISWAQAIDRIIIKGPCVDLAE